MPVGPSHKKVWVVLRCIAYRRRSLSRFRMFGVALRSCLSRIVQSVVDPLFESVDPGDQDPEPTRVDFLLEPSDLVIQIAKIVCRIGRVLTIGRYTGLQSNARPVGKLADFPAELDRTRPGALLARIVMRFLRLRVFHRWCVRCGPAVVAPSRRELSPSAVYESNAGRPKTLHRNLE
jgi:hypothetical protein